MQDVFAINRRNWDDRARVHLQDRNGAYGIDAFRAGKDSLFPIEAAEIGDIAGKDVLHLQCHFGLDSLSLARRGARVTGLDFSPVAIAGARALAEETGLSARFVEGNLYDAPRLIAERFDMVYTTWGTLMWLPDLRQWAQVVAELLKLGGSFYFLDVHPYTMALDEVDGRLQPCYAWRTPRDQPLIFVEETTYTGDDTALASPETRQWIHPLSDTVAALLEAGLTLDFLREHDVLTWQLFSFLEPAGNGLYRLPADRVPLPLSVSLRASKR